MNRFLLLFLCIVLSQNVNAQWRLIYQSKDILAEEADTTNKITSIQSRGALSKYLVVHSGSQQKTLVPKKAIWGYIDGNNRLWRSYNKEFYQVINYNGGWVEYGITRLVPGRPSQSFNLQLFSRTLDSRVYSNWMKAMGDLSQNYIVR
ncbi:hypothetical protein GO730_08860 [Spirosoma sp. HMF3257]|uniref:DUF4468 domain-containing protein n=1 Tax=Spirosoma telluris TaxID=2183553 RepID=A0A327NJZ4_9BACT|nr:hypothetical protein [Spirosoma telluris]RAI74366.1 hypothetical protein HMF3257_08775 [Spirosoma telluris]